jgi:hypothetical protein
LLLNKKVPFSYFNSLVIWEFLIAEIETVFDAINKHQFFFWFEVQYQ